MWPSHPVAPPVRDRDRLIAGAALGGLLLLAVLVGLLVRDAQNNAIDSREELRTEQVQQLARQMDSRIQSIFPAFTSLIGKPGQFNFRPNDPADTAQMAPLVAGDPTAGGYLVDLDRTIVNGVLLRSPTAVGRRIVNPELDRVYEGQPSLLSMDPEGLTTADPVIGIAIPTRDAKDAVSGAFVYESGVASDSAFSKEVDELRAGETGEFSFVDGRGTVVASSDEGSLAKPLRGAAAEAEPGKLRRIDGMVVVAASVPSADWTLAFQQTIDEFQGDVTGPVRLALLLLLAATGVAGAVAVVALLRRLRSAREEQRRLSEISAAREEFTSIVSHELRTPVAGLLGFLETVVDHWDDMPDTERKRAVQRSYANARTLRSLTADMLDSTSIDSHSLALHPEDTDLRGVVAEAIELMRAIDPERAIGIEEPADEVPVHVDPSRVGQIVSNLLDNAAKGSPAGSPIEVRIEVSGKEARVSVRDHGSGISDADRERVFEKFVRGAGITGPRHRPRPLHRPPPRERPRGPDLGRAGSRCRRVHHVHRPTHRPRRGGGRGPSALSLQAPATPRKHALLRMLGCSAARIALPRPPSRSSPPTRRTDG